MNGVCVALSRLIGTSVLACLYSLPSELVSFAKSLLATVAFVSNFFFWLHSGYFELTANQQPLLHTWSLAIEEQFYLLFPLLMILVARYVPSRTRLTVVLVALFSFVLGAVGAWRDPVAAFYLPHTRIWELLLGTILPMNVVPALRHRPMREIGSAVGIGLIIVPVFLFSELTPFPGFAALAPCLGAALVIHAGRDGPTIGSRILALKPLVFTGLISYSLYLWHWPLTMFQRDDSVFFAGVASATVKALIIVLAFAAAVLSWALIERPFRSGPLRVSWQPLFILSGAACSVLVLFSAVAVWSAGIPGRFSPDEIKAASYLNYDMTSDTRAGTCFVEDNHDYEHFNLSACAKTVTDRKNVLLLGDSYAADLHFGLSREFPEINLLQITGSGCRPTLEQAASTDLHYRRCATIMHMVFDRYLKDNKVDVLLLGGSWRDNELTAIALTLDWAKQNNIRVILFGPKVQYDAPLPRIMVAAIRQHRPLLPNDHRPSTFAKLDKDMERLAQEKGITYVSYFKLPCAGEICQYSDAGRPLTFDIAHLTRWGSLVVAEKLKAMDLPGLSFPR